MARYTIRFTDGHTERADDLRWVGSPEAPRLEKIVPHNHNVVQINGAVVERIYQDQGLLEEGGKQFPEEK